MRGYVENVKLDRGFGFIRCPDENKTIFFHLSDLSPALTFDEQLQQQRVTFDTKSTPKGVQATNIEPDES